MKDDVVLLSADFLVGKLANAVSRFFNRTIGSLKMKLNIRKAIWAVALAIVVTGFVTPKFAVAQQGQDNDQGYSKDNANNLMYQQGLSQGRADRANNRSHQYRLQPNNGDDRRAYESGYDQGYQNNRDANRNDNDQNGQYGPNDNVAIHNGFQDGANDGLGDRQAGKSSRATKHESYEHGNRGYNSSFGSKDQYKASYRQAYIRGYQKGYNGEGSDNR
jgi:hypothetical protein